MLGFPLNLECFLLLNNQSHQGSLHLKFRKVSYQFKSHHLHYIGRLRHQMNNKLMRYCLQHHHRADTYSASLFHLLHSSPNQVSVLPADGRIVDTGE